MSTSSSSSSSSNSTNGPIFKNSPQRFQKSRQKAAELVTHLVNLQQKGPRTLIAQVVDTDFHLTQGYCGCQTELGYVRVTGIPYGSVVQGMRVFCRQIGGMSTTKTYVFDGYAPALSTLGISGSLMVTNVQTTTSAPLTSSVSTVTLPSNYEGVNGQYWSFFFYLPELPDTPVTLMHYKQTNATQPDLLLDYLPNGQLKFWSTDNFGYLTPHVVPPHHQHFLMLQPGVGGNEILFDGVPNYQGFTALGPTFYGGTTNTYSFSFLSKVDGSQCCPVGTWISKISWGFNRLTNDANGNVILAGQPNVPEVDGDILNSSGSGGSAFQTFDCYLMNDAVGSTTLANNAASTSAACTLKVNGSVAALVQTGPY